VVLFPDAADDAFLLQPLQSRFDLLFGFTAQAGNLGMKGMIVVWGYDGGSSRG
jgi:hypothetical protein